MQGLMQDGQLTVDKILDHARQWHGHREIVTRSVEGPIVRTTYAQIHERAKRVSNALLGLGVRTGDRVATLAWNSGRHMEAWYGIMGVGAVCHTLNPRLFPEQIAWIVNHAEDKVIFVDLTFVPILEAILPHCPSVERVIIMTDEGHMPAFAAKPAHCFETLVAENGANIEWGGFDENTAAGLCYTSGTTGDPKGVLYSHRSNYLHTLVTLQRDVIGLSVLDVVLPVVPMFHANAWGLAFSCPAVGAKLVMPGPKMDGPSIHELLEIEGVTFSAAVPTVWQMLLQHLQATNGKLTTLKRVVIGGSAVPEAIVRAFHDDFGVEVVHAWGMTETSPLGTLSTPTPEIAAMPYDQQMGYRLKQGRPPAGVELKLTDDENRRQPYDGTTFGRLKIKGPFIVREYFKGAGGDILDEEGFFDTGDVATIDEHGFMQITDRAKDVIKSGGEWISSIEIENLAVGHPKAALAAVIGMPHPKWDERPLLLVKLKEGESATKEEFLQFLEGKIAKWWTPDDVVFVDDIPLGATGKIDKKILRQRFADYTFPVAAAVVAESASRPPTLVAPEPEGGSAEESPRGEPEAAAVADAAPAAVPDPAPDEVPAEVAADVTDVADESFADEVPPPLSGMPEVTPFVEATEPGGTPALAAVDAEFEPMAADEPLPPPEPAVRLQDEALIIPPTRTRPKKKRVSPLANGYLDLALLVAIAPALMIAVGAVGTKFGAWSWRDGFTAMLVNGPAPNLGWAPAIALVSVGTGLVGLIVALFAGFSRLWGRALLALLISIATLGGFVFAASKAREAPPIHDVATDWTDPLMFSGAIMQARGPEANYIDLDPVLPVGSRAFAGRRVADINAETCPGAKPVTVAKPPAEAMADAKAVLLAAGLDLVREDAANGRLEATATSFWYGFKDDVIVRVRPEGAGSRIDMRSVSRVGLSDLGQNCRRITALAAALG